MSSSASTTIERRDAAVAAALAGAVVVVLGYASGVGIQTSSDAVALQPPTVQPAAPEVQGTTTPPAVVAQTPILTAPAPTSREVHEHPRPVTPHDHTPAEPTPTPEPEPEPTPNECRPGLLESLPVAGPLVGVASSLLFGVVEATPVVNTLADPLACTVGPLVGPTCCATEPADTRPEAAP